MSMTMNIHNVKSIELGEIQTHTLDDCRVFYTRSIHFMDSNGVCVMRIDPFSDDGHDLLVSDPDLTQMMSEVLKKAA
jgi:hypothetical protein